MENAKCRREFGIFCAEKRKCCGFCDLLRGKCEMPQGIRSFRTEKAKCYAESRIFHTEGQQRSAEFGIFCAEKAKCAEFWHFLCGESEMLHGIWDFRHGKSEMLRRILDFLRRKSEIPIRLSNLEFSCRKVPFASVSTPARFPKFEGVTAIYSVSANFPSQKSGSPAGIRRGIPPGAKPQTEPQAGSKGFAFSKQKMRKAGWRLRSCVQQERHGSRVANRVGILQSDAVEFSVV